jgi:hypothetical protein
MIEQVFQLVPAALSLGQIYLDPNNPRFADDSSRHVSDEDIDQETLQKEIMSKMEREFAVDRLKDSMQSNGYLPIDRVVVRQFKLDKYVVLEGNRRITAAKRLLELHETKNLELDPRIIESLQQIPVLLYTGKDPEASWIFQGIRHISQIKDWSAYNKAKLLVNQMEEQGLSLAEAGRIFGISAWGSGQWVRGYYSYLQAKEDTDYQRDIDRESFPMFQELFGRSVIALKDWIEWNDTESKFVNEERFGEFLSWLYPKLNEQNEFDPDLPGDWSKRRINKALDLRLVSDLVSKHPEEFQAFRQGASLGIVVGRAAAKEEERAGTVEDIIKSLGDFQDKLAKLPIVQILSENKQEQVLSNIKAIKVLLTKIERLLKKA